MKPSLEQLKAARDVLNGFVSSSFSDWGSVSMTLTAIDAQIAAEEEREAKAKEWPQYLEIVHFLAANGSISGCQWLNRGWNDAVLEHGLAFKTKAEAELVRDFLRSRPRGWLLAMAKLGEWTAITNTAGRLSMLWHADKWNALTDDERKALLGQG